MFQNHGQPSSSNTGLPSPNLLDRRMWWRWPCHNLPPLCRSRPGCRRRKEARSTLTLYTCRKRRRRPQQKQTPLIFRTWPPNRLPARRYNGYSAPGAADSKLIFRSYRVTDWQGTAPQACGDRWCRRSTAEQCFNTSMALPTQADLSLIGSFLPGLSGQD